MTCFKSITLCYRWAYLTTKLNKLVSLPVSNLHNGIRLVDSEALVCITSFCFPSAAASVQCLAWVPSAPGMFITGGRICTFLPAASVNREDGLESCVCLSVRLSGGSAEGLERLPLHSPGQLQAEEDRLPHAARPQLPPHQER